MGNLPKTSQLMRLEKDASMFIPYTVPATREILKLNTGDYLQVFKLEGIAHECADPAAVFGWHNSLSGMLKGIAHPRVALWSHTLRREFMQYPGGEFMPGFAHDLNEKYRAKMTSEPMYINELYLSVVYRPNHVSRRVLNVLAGNDEAELREQRRKDIDACQKLAGTLLAGLDRYGVRQLGWYDHNGLACSEIEEFLAYLVNLRWQRRAVSRHHVRDSLAWTRAFFSKGGVTSILGPTHTRYAASLGIAEYQPQTLPGLVNQLLACPFELVLTQSFAFTSKEGAMAQIKLQERRMENVEDEAVSQLAELEDGKDDLASGRVVFGAHHFSLLVHADSPASVNNALDEAGSIMTDAGMKWAREDLASQSSFWAQLPGNFTYRPRIAPISNRNFAGFSSFHNFPMGRINGTQWGDCVTVFKTTSGSPYYFSWHKPDAPGEGNKRDPDHKELGNTLVIGKSGVGKTLLVAFLMSQSEKYGTEYLRTGNPTKRLSWAILDKDLSNSISVRQAGGRYYRIHPGIPTGWAPFQLKDSAELRQFIQDLVEVLAYSPTRPLTTQDRVDITNAIAGVLEGPVSHRRLSAMLEYLDPTDPEGVAARLKRWCEGGQYGWVFDNPVNTLDLSDVTGVGFDVTYFLGADELRGPVTMFLLHVIKSMLDGRRFPIFIEEAGIQLKDAAMQAMTEDQLVTIRKKNGLLILLGQGAEQFTENAASYAVAVGTATKIFMPNPEISRRVYVDKLGLTNAEFDLLVSLGERSRQFLIKQGDSSVVAELDLKGFDDEIAVLSSNPSNAQLVEDLIAELGSSPSNWIEEFHRRRKSRG